MRWCAANAVIAALPKNSAQYTILDWLIDPPAPPILTHSVQRVIHWKRRALRHTCDLRLSAGSLFWVVHKYEQDRRTAVCVEIITTDADELVAEIHDRMPFILPPAAISTRVNKPENDDPSIVEPIALDTSATLDRTVRAAAPVLEMCRCRAGAFRTRSAAARAACRGTARPHEFRMAAWGFRRTMLGSGARVCSWRKLSTADVLGIIMHVRFGPGITCAPQQKSPYSITSSAVARSVGGIVKPSVLAVLSLRTSSNLVGSCTGRSAGCSPLRIRPSAQSCRAGRSPG
jgi:hypothetical protein